MSKLSELKSRAARESLQKQRVARIKDAILDVVNSDSFGLSLLEEGLNKDSTKKQENFAELIANEVCKMVMNPTYEFIDTCKARGISDEKIMETVEAINSLFYLTESKSGDEKLEAVALYLADHPDLYNDIALLSD